MLAWRFRVLLCRVLLASAVTGWAQSALPDAPSPQTEVASVPAAGNAPWLPAAALAEPAAGQETFPPAAKPVPGLSVPGLEPTYVPPPRWCTAHACTESAPLRTCCEPDRDVFSAYLKQDAIHIYSPAELGRIAIHGVLDPFNLLTIGGTSVLSVATDSHSLYGPGVKGWAKLSGVTLAEDMTGEFVGTFLIPSIDHQDPHYHRMPNASLRRRILHCAYQPFWTTSDTGKGMINYSTFAGSIIDEAVDVTYVPYQKVGWGPGAERIASGWVSDPIGNFVTEFLPDVASHVNFKVVFIQRIVDRVALEDGGS
ncbi:MAG: hypothetical protein ABSA94_15475 [Acidobacteriaceae bacterium]|jgi:hypothetical protein